MMKLVFLFAIVVAVLSSNSPQGSGQGGQGGSGGPPPQGGDGGQGGGPPQGGGDQGCPPPCNPDNTPRPCPEIPPGCESVSSGGGGGGGGGQDDNPPPCSGPGPNGEECPNPTSA